MLPKKKRIAKDGFNGVIKAGKSAFSPFVSLRFTETFGKSRFAAVVPKAAAKKAVDRNHTRRRIYEAVQQFEKSVIPGYSCVFFAKKEAVSLPFTELTKTVAELLKKARLLK